MSMGILTLIGSKATFKRDSVFLVLSGGKTLYRWRKGDQCLIHGLLRSSPDSDLEVYYLYGDGFSESGQMPATEFFSKLATAVSPNLDQVPTSIYQGETRRTMSLV